MLYRKLLSLFVTVTLCGACVHAQEKVAIEWRFDKDNDDRGWKPSGHIADAKVQSGALTGRATGHDPIFFSPVFEIPATPLACVEICMSSTQRSSAELFWTQTLEGKFGGFSQEKHRLFTTEGDGKEHVYRVFPFWQSAGKIIRLRFDPPNEGTFAIKWIRILDRASGESSPATSWSAEQIVRDWRPLGDVAESADSPILASPPLSIQADDHAFVCVRLATNRPGTARLYAVSQSAIGWDTAAFPLRADGKPHSYNIDVGTLKTWQGQVVMLGVQLPAGSSAKFESIEVTREPGGPAEPEVAYFGPSEGINRAGRPAAVTLNLRNLGGRAAQDLTATLLASDGVRIVGNATQTIDRLSIYQPKTLHWQIQSDQPGKANLSVKIEASGLEPVTAATAVELTAVPVIEKSDYIPEPRPVKSKYELGAFYYPGWHSPAKWQPILDFPNRKPILGWYDEANPECADWQIKWAVEHGIKFFMVDWYWNQGHRHNEHWIHKAYLKARFRKHLQWAVMWANHNPPNTHSADDWRKVTQYWIDHYFHMPEYYRIDDKPAVFIWTPINLRRDLGGAEQTAKLYALSQEMARAAGYKGIYFVAVNNHNTADLYAQLKAESYQATTNYHGFDLARRLAGSDRFSFDRVVETAFDTWRRENADSQGLTYFPIVDTGWDARPWHAEKTVVISGRTPQLFGQLCKKARDYADQTNKRIIAIGPWNEWGEGSYIEPYAEHGFADIDQLRAAFCEPGDWPPNLIPSDVGRGGYDLPPVVARTTWEFNTDADLEGWTGMQMTGLQVKQGMLTGRSTGSDPIVAVSGLRIEADQFRRATLRLRSDTAGLVQVYWATSLIKTSPKTCVDIQVPGDGQFHDYEIDLAANPRWRGIITQLRLDPATKAGVNFAVDFMRLISEPAK